MTELNSFLDELQHDLNKRTRAEYGDAAFERWRNPPHWGKPEGTNATGASTGNCGETITIHLRIEGDTVRDAGFHTDGCGSSQVSGSMAAELAINARCEDIPAITGETVRDRLGGMPKEDEHCAFLAVNALHDALGDYYRKTLHPTETT